MASTIRLRHSERTRPSRMSLPRHPSTLNHRYHTLRRSSPADETRNMVDVFDVAPPGSASRGSSNNFAYAGQGARLARYQHLVSKLSNDDMTAPAGVKVGWLADDDSVDMPGTSPVSLKTQEGHDSALVGTFADAAAAASTTAAI